MNGVLDQLKDIKPPVEVPDHSVWLFLAITAALLITVGAAVWLLRKRPGRRRRRIDPVKAAKLRLKEIDFKDAKEAVYVFDEFFPVAAEGDSELIREFQALFPALEKYKYKKEVPPLAREDREKMEKLIKKVAG